MSIISFTYSVIDGKTPPQKSQITLFSANSGVLTTSELAEVARDMMPVVRHLMSGGIIDCTVSFHPDLSSAFAAEPTIKIPDPDSDVEEGAKFAFRPLDGDIRPMLVRIPSFREDLIISGTRIVDVDTTEVIYFVTAMTGGLFGYPFDFGFSNSRAEPLTIFLGAEENFKRRKNKRSR